LHQLRQILKLLLNASCTFINERNKKESGRKQKENSKKTIYSLMLKKTERKSLIFRDLNLELDIS